jgi:hypothetical protein
MDKPTFTDSEIRAGLKAAEARGMAMFDAIERAGLLKPGKTEKELDNDIFILAKRDFGVNRHWHKRVVRAGPNTVCIFADTPPIHTIAPSDTVYLDLGPVFASQNAQWEADIGRSYALGDDAEKKCLVADLPRLFDVVKAHYESSSDITGAQLYAFAQKAANFRTHSLFPATRICIASRPATPNACAIPTTTAAPATGFWKSIWWTRREAGAAFTSAYSDS